MVKFNTYLLISYFLVFALVIFSTISTQYPPKLKIHEVVIGYTILLSVLVIAFYKYERTTLPKEKKIHALRWKTMLFEPITKSKKWITIFIVSFVVVGLVGAWQIINLNITQQSSIEEILFSLWPVFLLLLLTVVIWGFVSYNAIRKAWEKYPGKTQMANPVS